MKKKLIVGLMLGLMTALTGAIFTGCQSGTTNESVESGNAPTSVECTHENVQETVLEATCKTAGQRHAVCLDCETVLPVETIDPLGHDLKYVETVEANCLAPKIIVSQCQREDCLEYVEETEGEPLGHDWKETARIAADCVNAEKATYTCDRTGCGTTKTETVEGGQGVLGHAYEAIESTRKDATCTEAGGVDYQCTRTGCEDGYSDVFPATGHTSDGEKADVTAPNCLEKGYTTYHCSVCNEDYTADYQNALGHHPVASGTVQATCSGVGYDAAICDRDGCDYIERTNIVANTAHVFGADGLCTGCGKDALNAFALVCTYKTQFAILQDGLVYTVYAPAYETGTKVKMPAELIAALYKEGVYSFTISMGSNEGKEAKSMEIKQASVSLGAVNVSANQMKTIKEFVFADENGIFDAYKDGIEYEVYYRVMDASIDAATGKTMISSYAISFSYIRQFDIEDSRTYLNTALTYTYDANSEKFTFTSIALNTENVITIRKELLAYYGALGYTDVKIVVHNLAGQGLYKQGSISSNGTALNSGRVNDNLDFGKIALTKDILAHNLDVQVYFADNYGPSWPMLKEPATGFALTVSFTKPLTLETCISPKDKALSSVEYSEADGWTLTNKQAVGNGYTTIISGEYLLKQIEAGNVRMTMTFDMANSATVTWFELIVTTTANTGHIIIRTNNAAGIGNTDKNGNRYFDLDLTNETYDYSKGVQIIFNNAYMSVESIEFFDEERKIAKDEYMAPENTAVSSVAYNAETGVYAITKVDTTVDGYNTKITTAVINEQIEKGMKVLRITFDKSVDGGTMPWVQISLVSNASGSDAWVILYGNGGTMGGLATDKDGNKYCNIDLTNANYRWTNNAYGVRIVLTQASAGVKLSFWEEIPEEYYFRPDTVGKSKVSYDETNKYWVVEKVDNAIVYLLPDVIQEHMAKGARTLRVTFTGTPVSTSWLEAYAWKDVVGEGGSTTVTKVTLQRQWQVKKDENNNEYFEIDLTQGYKLTTGYGVQLVFSQATTNVSLDFIKPAPIAPEKYVVSEDTTKGTVAYSDGSYTFTHLVAPNGANIKVTTDVIKEQISLGKTKVRITFTADFNSSIYALVQVVSNASGSDAWVNLAREFQLGTDANGCKYVEVDLTKADYVWSNSAYGLRVVFTQATATFTVSFS